MELWPFGFADKSSTRHGNRRKEEETDWFNSYCYGVCDCDHRSEKKLLMTLHMIVRLTTVRRKQVLFSRCTSGKSEKIWEYARFECRVN